MLVFWGTKEPEYQTALARLCNDWGIGEVRLRSRTSCFVANPHYYAELRRAQFVLIWNGRHGTSQQVAEFCRRQCVPHAFIEWGMMPQDLTYTVDATGFCGDSMLCGPIGWLKDADYDFLAESRSRLRESHPHEPDGRVLVVMQIEKDSQIVGHTPYFRMGEFVEDVVARWPGAEIVVKPHPRSGGSGPVEELPERVRVLPKDSDFLEECSKASVVVGLTSTCLYEAAVYGVPVVALGDHPLRSHPPRDHDMVAAAALAMTCSRSGHGLAHRLERIGVGPRREP